MIETVKKELSRLYITIKNNDSMTDEIGAEINCHRVINITLKIKYKAYRQSSKKKTKNIGLASYTKTLTLFGNLPCREFLERMKDDSTCPKDKKVRCHWYGYPL